MVFRPTSFGRGFKLTLNNLRYDVFAADALRLTCSSEFLSNVIMPVLSSVDTTSEFTDVNVINPG